MMHWDDLSEEDKLKWGKIVAKEQSIAAEALVDGFVNSWNNYSLDTKLAVYNAAMVQLLVIIRMEVPSRLTADILDSLLLNVGNSINDFIIPKLALEKYQKSLAMSDAELKRMMEL